jgi:hypothetical protein
VCVSVRVCWRVEMFVCTGWCGRVHYSTSERLDWVSTAVCLCALGTRVMCVRSPCCVGIVMLGEKGVAAAKANKGKSFCCNLQEWLDVMEKYENKDGKGPGFRYVPCGV